MFDLFRALNFTPDADTLNAQAHESTNVEPGDFIPINGNQTRCLHVRPGYAQFPARCHRPTGHEGNHAATTHGQKVAETWDAA